MVFQQTKTKNDTSLRARCLHRQALQNASLVIHCLRSNSKRYPRKMRVTPAMPALLLSALLHADNSIHVSIPPLTQTANAHRPLKQEAEHAAPFFAHGQRPTGGWSPKSKAKARRKNFYLLALSAMLTAEDRSKVCTSFIHCRQDFCGGNGGGFSWLLASQLGRLENNLPAPNICLIKFSFIKIS